MEVEKGIGTMYRKQGQGKGTEDKEQRTGTGTGTGDMREERGMIIIKFLDKIAMATGYHCLGHQ